MQVTKVLGTIFIALLLNVSAYAGDTVEGEIVSIPVSISLDDLASGEIKNLNFTGASMKVKLSYGEVVDVPATEDQMSEAFAGKRKATLQKSEDEEWVIVNLEKQSKQ